MTDCIVIGGGILGMWMGGAAAMGGMGDGIADRPYFAEAPDPLPVAPLVWYDRHRAWRRHALTVVPLYGACTSWPPPR